MRFHSKQRFRFLLWLIFGTLIFICVLLITIARHETTLREDRERRLLSLLRSQEHQHQRRLHISKTCYKLTDPHPVSWTFNNTLFESQITEIQSQLDHFIVDDINKLIYCFVPKVASTNWKRVLLALASKKIIKLNDGLSDCGSQQINPLYYSGNESHLPTAFRTLNQYDNISDVINKLTTYLKFMFVRHPYERLLSAYRNKLEHTYSDYFRRRFGRKIIKQLRYSASNESLEKGHDVTFDEFLTYVTTLNKSDHKREFNEHWRPINDLCLPCLIDYDVIGKYETLSDDAQLVLWKAHVINVVRFPRRETTYSSQPSRDLMKQYYGNISQTLLSKISKIYNDDIQLFQYNEHYQFDDRRMSKNTKK